MLSQNVNQNIRALARALGPHMNEFVEQHASQLLCDVRPTDDVAYWWERGLCDAFVTEWFRRIHAGRPTWQHRRVTTNNTKVTILSPDRVDWLKKGARIAELQAAPANYGKDRRFGYTEAPGQTSDHRQATVIADKPFSPAALYACAAEIVTAIKNQRRENTTDEHVCFALRLAFDAGDHVIGFHLRLRRGDASAVEVEGDIPPGALHVLEPNLGEFEVAGDADHEQFVRTLLQVYSTSLRRFGLVRAKVWWGGGTQGEPRRHDDRADDDFQPPPAGASGLPQDNGLEQLLESLDTSGGSSAAGRVVVRATEQRVAPAPSRPGIVVRARGILPGKPPKPNDHGMRALSYASSGLVNIISSAGWRYLETVPELQPAAQSLGSACKNLFGGVSDWNQENKTRAKGQWGSVSGQILNTVGAAGSRAHPNVPAFRFVRGIGLLVYAGGQAGIGQGDIHPHPKGKPVVVRGWSYRLSSLMNFVGAAGHIMEGVEKLGTFGDPASAAAIQATNALVAFANFTNAVTSFGGALGHHLKGRKEGNPWNPKVIGQLVTGLGYVLSGAATTALQSTDGLHTRNVPPWIWVVGFVGMTLVYVGNYITMYGELYKKKAGPVLGLVDEEHAVAPQLTGAIALTQTRTRSPAPGAGRVSPVPVSPSRSSTAGTGAMIGSRAPSPSVDPMEADGARILAEARAQNRKAAGLTEQEQADEDQLLREMAAREIESSLEAVRAATTTAPAGRA